MGLIEAKPEESRSSAWPHVRLEHLKIEPFCQACGDTVFLTVHHVLPFHLFKNLELDPTNLITLCENPGFNCHYFFGHNRNWHRYVPDVRAMIKIVLTALKATQPPLAA